MNDEDNLFACATNEGRLYPLWLAMARAPHNTPDSDWTDPLRHYARQLVREGRATQGALVASCIISAAARLRDYYIQHVEEAS